MILHTHDGVRIRILLVEDNADVSESMGFLLSQIGCEIASATCAAEALAHSASEPFHAVYSSLMLRDMHGFELAATLRAMPGMAGSVLVALTGYATTSVASDARRAGFDHYLLKPVSFSQVLEPLREIPGFAGAAVIDRASAEFGAVAGSRRFR